MKARAVTVFLLLAIGGLAHAEDAESPGLRFVNPEVTAATNIHFNKRFCTECHEKTPDTKGRTFLRFGDYSRTCRCHGYTPDTYTHPVGIEPSPEKKAKIPPQFPLTAKKITCNTCHAIALQCRPENDAKRHNKAFLRIDPFLSRTAICFQCHDERKYKMLDPHNQLDATGNIVEEKCLYCHTVKPDEKQATLKKRGGRGQVVKLIGDLAVLCHRCHSKQSLRHPINAEHLKKPSPRILSYMRESERQLGIVLPLDYRGRITCATCHNPHERGVIPAERAGAAGAGEKLRLRVSATADKICLACHKNK